jgi:dTDP-glucose pyrophosphorylase
MPFDVTRIFTSSDSKLLNAIEAIDKGVIGIALVVDSDKKLLGTIVDGDIRRAILRGNTGDTPVQTILDAKPTAYRTPVSALQGTDRQELLRMMHQRSVRHIPIVDAGGVVVDLFTVFDVISHEQEIEKLPIRAVVMAGGIGSRLRPLTYDIPKPMLPVGGHPLLEWILSHLRDNGIEKFYLTTHYKSEIIQDYFKDGEELNISIEYIDEKQLTGTAGSLALLEDWSTPILVINGDILTRVDVRAMWNYHQDNDAMMTVAMRSYDVTIPYGTINLEGTNIKGITEKPTIQSFVSAGIYIIEPKAQSHLKPQNEYFDMPDLISNLIESGHTISGFPLTEYWLDIGQHQQYEQAQNDIKILFPDII